MEADNTDPRWYEILCFAITFCVVIYPIAVLWAIITIFTSNDVDEFRENFL